MKLVGQIGRVIKLNWKNILAFELFYRLFTLTVYYQFFNQGLRLSLRLSGYSYVTLGNLFFFLLRPGTILFVFLAGLLGLFFFTVEMGSLMTAYQGCAYLRKVSPPEMLIGGLEKTRDEIRKKNIKLFPVIAGTYVINNLFPVYRLLTQIKPVNFIIDELLATRYGKPGLILGILCLGAVLVPFAYVLHFSMIEQKYFPDSTKGSIRLVRKTAKPLVLLYLLGNVALALAVVLLYFLGMTVLAVFITLFIKRNLQLIVLTGTAVRLQMIFMLLYSTASCVGNLGLLTVFYYKEQEREMEQHFWRFSGRFFGTDYKRKLILFGTIAALISGLTIFDLAYNGSRTATDVLTEIQITAHRGDSRAAPENTMAALESAVESMADFAEIDVQESKDKVLVVCHDANLKRLAGLNKEVKDLTFEELKQLDVGSHFSDSFAGETIPELVSVMEYAKGKINLNIELKNAGRNTDMPARVAELIKQMGMTQQCVVTSVNLSYLTQIREINPDIKTGYVIAAAYGDFYSNPNIDFISIRSDLVTAGMVQKSQEAGKAVHVWTVNSKPELARMKQLRVDNVITDYPVRAREIIYRDEITETLLEYLRMVLK